MSTVEIRGRARKRSRSPASASQRRTTASTSRGAVDERDVLARLGEQREVLDELALLERHVRRADLRPHDVELRQLVVERGGLAQVLQRAGAAHAGAEVERLGDAAAGREVEGLALVQEDVVGLGEAGEQDAARALRERPLDELARKAGDARRLVHSRAARGELGQNGRAGEAHAHAGEQLHRLVGDRSFSASLSQVVRAFIAAFPRRCRVAPGLHAASISARLDITSAEVDLAR